MIAGGIHTPKEKIKAGGQPDQRMVIGIMKRRKYPVQVRDRESAIIGILNKIIVIVPYKAIVQRQQETGKHYDGNENDEQTVI